MTDHSNDPRELAQAQIPAVQLLAALGYEVLSPGEALGLRRGRRSNPLLETVLEDRILAINTVRVRQREYPLSLEDAREAIRKLQDQPPTANLLNVNRMVYDMLLPGVAVSKTVEGSTISPQVRFVDWHNPENNVYHVTVEYPVAKGEGRHSNRLDVVAFVNGIPFVTIECKRPDEPVGTARGQLIRYQRADESSVHFRWAQLLIAANRQDTEYATVGTPAKFWGVWKHPEAEPDARAEMEVLAETVRTQLTLQARHALGEAFGEAAVSEAMRGLELRTPSAQDATLYALCRPERLLDLVRNFTVFDGGVRKVARYQQFFAVKRALERLTAGVTWAHSEARPGGLIWHTQGSGKSLTMVMLAKALEQHPDIPNPRVILVTDRDDLDVQIRDTFRSCGLEPVRARSGQHLAELIVSRAPLITTIVNKFEGALADLERGEPDLDRNLFVLVDEAHRSHSARKGDFGYFATRMHRSLPLAAYVGFTGTPLMKNERNSFRTFGDLIHRYTIADANRDGAVVPLYYEGRIVEQQLSGETADTWFERYCDGLTSEQQADLKRKFSRTDRVAGASQVVRAKAFDISEHYRRNWQGTGLKAQIVAPDKAAAIRFKEVLDELGDVTSKVIISPPGENSEEESNEARASVRRFWGEIVRQYGSEAEYNKQIIDSFKGSGGPEILIVVSKLLTGFDAPRNTVLYLCRPLRDHTLLQAIARVNRLYEPECSGDPEKKHGIVIDYEGMLKDLDRALTEYSALDDFEAEDLASTIVSVREEIDRLSARWNAVWKCFDGAPVKDMESLEVALEPIDLRREYYQRLTEFTGTLHLALSSTQFDDLVPKTLADRYRADWKFFVSLRRAAQFRYNEKVDLRDYEPKMQKLLDDHLMALPARVHIEPLDLTDPGAVAEAASTAEVSAAARADRIAHATKKRIHEKIDEDPVLYLRFSQLVQQTIDAFKGHRIDELEYLEQMISNSHEVETARHVGDDVPELIRGDEAVTAVYAATREIMRNGAPPVSEENLAKFAGGLVDIIAANCVIEMWENPDTERELTNEIYKYLWSEPEGELGVELPEEAQEKVLVEVLRIAKARFP